MRSHPGSAAPSGPALRRHGDLPGPARFGRAAAAGHHARPRGGAVGQGRLRGPGADQGGPAGAGHDGRAQGIARAHPPSLRRGGGSGASAAERSAGVSLVAESGHHRRVSGGEPRADVLPAAPAPEVLLRHRGAGRHHPAGADRRQNAESLPAAPAGFGGGNLPASAAGAGAEAHSRCAAFPGTVAANGDDRRRVSPAARPRSCGAPLASSARRSAWRRWRRNCATG